MAEETNTTVAESVPETPSTSTNSADVHPLTGGVRANSTHPLTGGTYNPRGASKRAVSRGLDIGASKIVNYRDNLKDYADYGVQLSPYLNLEEERAKRQSTAEKWGHGIAKALVTTGGAVAENTVGLLAGIGESIANRDVTKLYDNSVGRAVDKVNAYMQENLPNYYTQQEQNAQGLSAMGYANFWADKALNGLGYSLGSIATVYLTGGQGLISRATGLGKYAQASLQGAKAVHGGTQAAKGIAQGAKAASAFSQNFAKAVTATELGFMMSVGESSVEAREVLNGYTESEMEKYAHANGISVNEVPEDVQRDIKNRAANAANATWALNLGVLSATNLITFGGHLMPKYLPRSTGGAASRLGVRGGYRGSAEAAKAARAGQKAAQIGRQTGVETAGRAAERASKDVAGKAFDLASDPRWAQYFGVNPKLAQVTGKYIAPAATGGLSEGFQEATQFAISQGQQNRVRTGAGNWISATMEGYNDTFGTKEGVDNTLVGIVVGMLTGGMGSIKTALNNGMTSEDQRVAQMVEFLNDEPRMMTYIQRAQQAGKTQEALAVMNAALTERQRDAQGKFTGKVGNHKAYADAQFEALQSEVLMHLEAGTIDVFMERLEMEKDKTDEEYFTDHGIEEQQGKYDKNELVESLKSKIGTMRKNYEYIDAQFATTPRTEGIDRLFMTKEDKIRETEQALDEGFYKRLLWNNSTNLENIDGRMENLVAEINALDPVLTTDAKDRYRKRTQRKGAVDVDAGQAGITAQSINEIFDTPIVGELGLEEDGTVQIKTLSDLGTIIGQERLQEFADLIDRVAKTNPAKAADLQEKLLDLMSLAQERRRATGALNNLYAPPKQREAYLKRMEMREEMEAQAAKDADIREAMSETTTSEQLKKFGEQHPDASDAMQQEITDEITRREAEEGKFAAEAEAMSPAELQKEIDEMQDKEDADKLRLDTFRKVLKEAKDTGRTGPKVDTPSNPETVDEVQEPDAQDEAGEGQPPVDEPGAAGAVDEPGNPAAAEESGNIPDAIEESQAAAKEIDNVTKTAEEADNQAKAQQSEESKSAVPYSGGTITLAGTQYQIAGGKGKGKLRVLANPSGTPIETGGSYIINGETRRVENDVWAQDTKGNNIEFILEDNSPESQEPGNVKVVMLLNGKVAGAVKAQLPTAGNAYNERAYIVKQLREGKKVTATIKDVEYSNFNNLSKERHVNEEATDDQKFFFPVDQVTDSDNFVGLAVVRGIQEGGEMVKVFDPGATSNQELIDAINRGEVGKNGSVNFDPGMVVAVIKDPSGNYRPANLSTRKLSKKVRGELLSLLQTEGASAQDAIDTVLEVMGSPQYTPNPEIKIETRPIQPKDENGDNIGEAAIAITFKDANGRMVRVYSNQLRKAINGEAATADVGSFEKDTWTKTERIDFDSDLLEALKEKIKNRRYNVNASRINNPDKVYRDPMFGKAYDNYEQYLSDPEMVEEGDIAPLVGDFKENRGSYFNDPKITLELNSPEEVKRATKPEPDPNPAPEAAPQTPVQDSAPFPTDTDAPAAEVIQGETEPEVQPAPETTAAVQDPASVKITNPRVYNEGVRVVASQIVRDLDANMPKIKDYDQRIQDASTEEERDDLVEERREFIYDLIATDGIELFTDNLSLTNPAFDEFRKNLIEADEFYDTVDEDTDFVLSTGFATDVLKALDQYGYPVRLEAKAEDRNKMVADLDLSENGLTYDKIYSKTNFETDPQTKLSDEAKRLLSRMPLAGSAKQNSTFGEETLLPISEVYPAVVSTVYGSLTPVDMIRRLSQVPSTSPIAPVAGAVLGMNAQQLATMWSNFGSLDITEFTAIDPIINEETGEAIFRVYNANSGSVSKEYTRMWRKNSESGAGAFERTASPETGKDVISMPAEQLKRVRQNFNQLNGSGYQRTPANLQAAAELMVDLGIDIAPNIEAVRERLELATAGENATTSLNEVFRTRGKLGQITLSVLNNPQSMPDIHAAGNEAKTMSYIANKLVKPFESPSSVSFLMNGKMIYPINYKTELHHMRDRVKSGEAAKELQNTIGHDSPVTGVRSLALTLLQDSTYREAFEIDDLGFVRLIGKGGVAQEYENMGPDELMLTALMRFTNSRGKKGETKMGYTTQADRKKSTYGTFVDIESNSSRNKFGLPDLKTLLKNEILLDFHRAHSAELSRINGGVEYDGYHSEWARRMNLPGVEYNVELGRAIYNYMEYGKSLTAEQENQVMEFVQAVQDYANTEAQRIQKEFPGISTRLELNQGSDYLNRYGGNTDAAFNGFLKNFVMTDILAKKMQNQLLRGGTKNWTKDDSDFIKRANLISTPRNSLYMAGSAELENVDSNYGMPTKFTHAVVSDWKPATMGDRTADFINAAEQLAKLAGNALKDKGAISASDIQAFEESVTQAYLANEATDAQSYVSLSHYRDLLQGKGLWGDAYEQAYQDYYSQTEGLRRWQGPPLTPLKPSFDTMVPMKGQVKNKEGEASRTQMIPYHIKTSYFPLVEEVVAGRPMLEQMLERMERPDATIDVISVVTATKLARANVADLSNPDWANTLEVVSLDSRGLGFPQDIRYKGKDTTNNSRQMRKIVPSDLVKGHNYKLTAANGDTVNAKREEVMSMYHEAVARKLEINRDRVEKDLKYISSELAPFRGEKFNKKYLVGVRDRLIDMAEEKGLSESAVQSMRIAINEAGEAMTGLAIGFPQFQRRFDSLFFSIIRNNVYQQKMPGMDLVQIAEFGAHEETGELQYIRDEKGRIIGAEVEVGVDQLRDFGIYIPNAVELVGQDLDQIEGIPEDARTIIAYRTPNSAKSFTVPMRIKRLLPSSHKMAIRVPAKITTATGSDFDIDKLSVIFPHMKKDGTGRVRVPYQSIQKNLGMVSTFTEQQVDNMMIDIYESILGDPIHADETVAPEGMPDIQDALDNINMSKRRRIEQIDIFSPITHIKAAEANMLSHKLRGIYADAMAGRSVLTSLPFFDEVQAVKVDIVYNGQETLLDGYTTQARFKDPSGVTRTTGYYMNQYLGAAVDSVKDPVQKYINDNEKTAKMNIFLMQMGLTPQQIIPFLTHPSVRELTDQLVENDVSTLGQLGDVVLEGVTYNVGKIKREGGSSTVNLDNPGDMTNKNLVLAVEVLLEEGNKLFNTYSLLTLDNIDQGGTVASHQAKLDEIQYQLNGGGFLNPISLNEQQLREIFEGDANKTVRAYYETMQNSMRMAADAGMIAGQPAVDGFKNYVKGLTGKSFLTEAQHRYLNTIVAHHLATRPGSPLFESGYMDESAVRDALLDPTHNMHVRLDALKALPELQDIKLLKGLNPETVDFAPDLGGQAKKVYTLVFNNADSRSAEEQSEMQREWERMLNNPESFGLNEVATEVVRKFAKDLVTTAVVTSGFEPGPKAFFSLLPQSVFGVEIGRDFSEGVLSMDRDASALNELKQSFTANYGHHKFDHSSSKPTLFPRISAASLKEILYPLEIDAQIPGLTTRKNPPAYIIADDVFGNDHLYALQYGPSNSTGRQAVSYSRVLTKGIQGVLHEANIRDANGNPIKGSLLGRTGQSANATTTKPRLSRNLDMQDSGAGMQSHIGKLKQAFREAGIDVIVQEGSLPKGTKGMVEGDVVTFDPSQVTSDTAYHEFGHILVDMLPKEEAMRYAKQVEKARPELGRQVRAKYAQDALSESDMLKEILVTAVGLEGAKLEKKNPSLIQRIVNKILRAIGKIFGVTPDAASVLAEKMFAGNIRDLNLNTQEFNPAVRRSRDMQQEVEDLYNKAATQIQSEIYQLERIPEQNRDNDQIRRLKELKKSFQRLTKNRNDIQAVREIQEYIVFKAAQAKEIMEEVKKEKAKTDAGAKVTLAKGLGTLNRLNEVKNAIDGVQGSGNFADSLSKLLQDIQGDEAVLKNKDSLIADLAKALVDIKELDAEYRRVGIPLIADTFVNVGNEEVNPILQEIIDKARENKDITGIDKRNPAFAELKAKYNRGEVTKEQYTEEALDIKEEEIKNKKLSRAAIVKELTDAHVDKSGYSFYMDPLIYSSEQNLQLFAMTYLEQTDAADQRAIKTLYKLKGGYEKFLKLRGMSGRNNKKLNDPILTEVEMPDGTKVLNLVSEYDTGKYYSNRKNAEDARKAKYGWPRNKKGGFVSRESEEFKQWAHNGVTLEDGRMPYSDKYKNYSKDRNKWSDDNSVPKKDAKAIAAGWRDRMISLTKEAAELQEQFYDAKTEEWETSPESMKARDKWSVIWSEYYELKRTFDHNITERRNADGDIVLQKFHNQLTVPNKKYESEKYKAIQASPELKNYYDLVVDTYFESQKRYGKGGLRINSWDEFSYQMPNVRKEDIDKAQEDGVFAFMKEKTGDLGIRPQDEMYGEMVDGSGKPMNGIPRLYHGTSPAKDVSRDVLSSIMIFSHGSEHFQAKSEMQGLVNLMLDVHANRETLQTDPTTGMKVINTVAKMAGAKGTNLNLTKKGIDSNTYKHLESFIEANYYGQFDIPMMIKGVVEANKLASTLGTLTALNTLSLNTLQAGNQFILDNLMTWEEGWAEQFYSKKNHAYAVRTYTAGGGALSDVGKVAPESKLGKALMMMDGMMDLTDGFGRSLTGGKMKKSISTNSAFFLQHSVEHQTSSVRMLSLMDSYRGKLKDKDGNVIKNKDGKPANVYDVLIEDANGVLIVDPKVANFSTAKFKAKLRSISKKTNQIKGRVDKSHFQRGVFGKLMMLFRNYFQPQLRKRFGHGDGYHVDQEAGAVSKGMYVATFDYLKRAIFEGNGLMTTYKTANSVDQAEVRRTMFEAVIVMTTVAVGHMLAGMMDDDDENNYAVRFMAYQTRRLQTELLQFLTPGEFLRILDSPTATANLSKKWLNLIDGIQTEVGYQIGIVPESDARFQRDTALFEKGDAKVRKDIARVLPAIDGIMSTMTPEEKLKFLLK